MIAIIDYGMGNLRSVQKAFEHVGASARIVKSPAEVMGASKIVLPGVGAMAPAIAKLQELGLVGVIRKTVEDGKPFLGICLGFQLLFEKSSEGGYAQGLNILKGTVERFDARLNVPHMGWNQVKVQGSGQKMFAGISDGADVYFCHSFYVKPADPSIVAAVTDYGVEYASAVAVKNIWGVQFHPEKSQTVGLHILRNFANA